MPSHRHHEFGNLYIVFDVKFPKSLDINDEQVRMLESILPPRNTGAEAPKDAMTDDFQLEDVDPTRDQKVTGGGIHAEDEDEEAMGGDRVQCPSQ